MKHLKCMLALTMTLTAGRALADHQDANLLAFAATDVCAITDVTVIADGNEDRSAGQGMARQLRDAALRGNVRFNTSSENCSAYVNVLVYAFKSKLGAYVYSTNLKLTVNGVSGPITQTFRKERRALRTNLATADVYSDFILGTAPDYASLLDGATDAALDLLDDFLVAWKSQH